MQYPFQSEESTEEEESFDEVELSEEGDLPSEGIEESSSLIEETNEPGVATLRATWCRFCTLFLSDPGVPGVRSMGPVVSHKLREVVADLTDVTLVDEDTN